MTGNGELSSLAAAVLADHRKAPSGRAFYDLDILGSMFDPKSLERLDAAYEELKTKGLVQQSGSIVSFFGNPKPLYMLAEEGQSNG